MLTLVVLTCLIFQTAVAIYLLHTSLIVDDFEKHMQKLMVILLIHLCVNLGITALLNNSPVFGHLSTGFGLLYGPFLFIITRTFIGNPLTQKQKQIHLSPFFILSSICIGLIIGAVSKIISPSFLAAYAACYKWVVIASMLYYCFMIKKELQRQRPSHGDKNKTAILGQIASILQVIAFVNVLLTVLHYFEGPGTMVNTVDFKFLPYFLHAFIPICILRYKLQQKSQVAETKPVKEGLIEVVIEKELPQDEIIISVKAEKRYEKSGLDEQMLFAYKSTLLKFVEKSKIYLDTELSLDELALQSKIPKHHLTQLLNDCFKKNFYSFINEYRVAEAARQLKDPASDFNILSLAFDCGFNSKSSFNNYFKKVTGNTPSAYRKMMLERSNTSKQLVS